VRAPQIFDLLLSINYRNLDREKKHIGADKNYSPAFGFFGAVNEEVACY
jgi:hypothetical protein